MNKIIEVEHENLILGNKLIELYEEKIKILEARISELESKTQIPPGPIHIPMQKPRMRTRTEIIQALELSKLRATTVSDKSGSKSELPVG